jgi:hypothetical protein
MLTYLTNLDSCLKKLKESEKMYREILHELDLAIENIRDEYHFERELLAKKINEKNSEKKEKISKLVLRKKFLPISTKKVYKKYSVPQCYKLHFYISYFRYQMYYVPFLKSGKFSASVIVNNKGFAINEQEVPIIDYYVDKVNMINQQVEMAKKNYLDVLNFILLLEES